MIQRLILVTGRPGSGKTTLARTIAGELGDSNLELFGRDDFKHSVIKDPRVPAADANRRTTELFWTEVTQALNKNQSVLAEAAFQHNLWSKLLAELTIEVDTRIIHCDIDPEVAIARYQSRADKAWRELHGEELPESLIRDYKPLISDWPTTTVNTSEKLDLASLVDFCRN